MIKRESYRFMHDENRPAFVRIEIEFGGERLCFDHAIDRLMWDDAGPVRPPVTSDAWELMDFQRRMEMRSRLADQLGRMIANSFLKAIAEKEKP